jgi:RNA polymerase sigma factor (sigma-70 family)
MNLSSTGVRDMTANPILQFLNHVRRTALLHDSQEQSDGQLLERFVGGDGVALEMLVRRHAPMVWGVCRRNLARPDDAEDAFQATFLVLLRKAGTIWPRELLANWLYGVAYKTACKARQTAAKRGAREKQVKTMPEPPLETSDDTFAAELLGHLDRELSGLPEKYRTAIVLCELQGRTLRDAARQLRVAEGTVASRLARGREMLAKRMSWHGAGLSAGTVAAVFSQQAASGALPNALLTRTIDAVRLMAAEQPVMAGLLSAEASTLKDAVLHSMAATKWKAASVVLLLAALAVGGGAVAYHSLPDQPSKPKQQPKPVGEVRRFEGHTMGAWGLAFSPDGRHALSGAGDGTVRLWEVATGREVRRFTGYTRAVDDVSFSSDGCKALTAIHDGTARLWDVQTGNEILVLRGHTGEVHRVAFSPDGRRALSGSHDHTARLWDLETGNELRRLPGYCGVAFSPDGRRALTESENVLLWDVETGARVRELLGHRGPVTSVVFLPGGRQALSSGHDSTLRLWDLDTGQEIHCFSGHTGEVNRVAITRDGRAAVSGSEDKTVRVWDLQTGKELQCFTGHTEGVIGVAVSPDGRYALSGSHDGTMRLWRLPGLPPA